MKRSLVTGIVLMLILAIALPAESAEIVKLSGQKFKGKIIAETDTAVRLEISMGGTSIVMGIRKKDIHSITDDNGKTRIINEKGAVAAPSRRTTVKRPTRKPKKKEEPKPEPTAEVFGFLGDGTGRYPEARPPLKWSSGSATWSASMPDWGNSSPAVSGNYVFVCAEPDKLICVDARSGRILWTKSNSYADAGVPGTPMPKTHQVCGYSSPSPVTDGKHVFTLYGTGVAACYTVTGQRVWIKYVESPTHGWGHCMSPVLKDGKVFIHIKNMTALDAKTGEKLWATPAREGWGSPVLAKVGNDDVTITCKGDFIKLADGSKMAGSKMNLEFNGPMVFNNIAYFIQNGGKAIDLKDTSLPQLWSTNPKRDRYYANPVYHEGLIYDCTQNGQFCVIDAKNGQVIHEERLGIGGGNRQVYPSCVMAGGYIFVSGGISGNQSKTFVFKPGRTPQKVGENTLDKFRCTPVFVGGRMYIRSLNKLYCFGR